MSQENIEVFRRQTDAWNRDDLDAYLTTVDPEAELYPGPTRVAGGVFRGHDGVKGWWVDVHDTFEVLTVAFDEVRDLGDTVLGLGRLRGRSKSGVPIDTEYGAVTRFRDGLTVSARSFTSHEAALEAAGLSE